MIFFEMCFDVLGYALALDMTAREIQASAKVRFSLLNLNFSCTMRYLIENAFIPLLFLDILLCFF